ncbi:MAG: transposase [Gammaproteobacteria bacterium]|nr:transposase [Gammaproteobacteria bacterium]
MSLYIRQHQPGGTYFFTVNLAQRHRSLLTENIDTLRAVFREVRSRHPFQIKAIVILPEHLHCLWRLPENDTDYALRWGLIKANFSRRIKTTEPLRASLIRRGERGIWQRRFWEYTIRDEADWQRHLNYIHFNPVKHRYVRKVCDWPWSSFHQFVRRGEYPEDWGGNMKSDNGNDFGE